jgi:hypothetical protein
MRCPVCKVENDQGPTCRRCKADLSLLFALEDQRTLALERAVRGIAEGQAEEAYREACRADAMRRDEHSLKVRAVAALLARDFAGAWECYQATSDPSGAA